MAQKIKIAWNNPFTQTPNNQPRIVFETIINKGVDYEKLPEYQAVRKLYPIGSGYGVHIDFVDTASYTRKRTRKQKAKVRRKNLRNRIQKKLDMPDEQIPMFSEFGVDAEFKKQVNKRSDYFSGGNLHIEKAKQRVESIKKKQEKVREKYTKQQEG